MKKLILLLLLSPILIGCPGDWMDVVYRHTVKNNAEHSIGVYYGVGFENTPIYPNTNLPIENRYIVEEVKSKTEYYYDLGYPWDELFKQFPQDTFSLFIFHTDTLKKYSWQEVRDGYKVLKRYDLSLEDIKRMNYTITYP